MNKILQVVNIISKYDKEAVGFAQILSLHGIYGFFYFFFEVFMSKFIFVTGGVVSGLGKGSFPKLQSKPHNFECEKRRSHSVPPLFFIRIFCTFAAKFRNNEKDPVLHRSPDAAAHLL